MELEGLFPSFLYERGEVICFCCREKGTPLDTGGDKGGACNLLNCWARIGAMTTDVENGIPELCEKPATEERTLMGAPNARIAARLFGAPVIQQKIHSGYLGHVQVYFSAR